MIITFAIGQTLVTTKYNEVQFTMSLIVKNIEMRLDSMRLDTCCDVFLSAIFLDVDNFKMYNDAHNHAYGDAVLKFVGQSLVHSTRPSTDTCVRYAGDEFIVLLRDTPISVAVQIAERLQATLKTYVTDDKPKPVSISRGIASAQKEEMTLEELIAWADDATYDAKHTGKSTVSVARDAH